MFEIRCIVSDKALHHALRALDPFALEPPVAKPVAETMALPNGKVIPQKERTSEEVVLDFLTQNKLKTVTAKQMRFACLEAGLSKNGYSYAKSALLKKGVLKKAKQKFTYEVRA